LKHEKKVDNAAGWRKRCCAGVWFDDVVPAYWLVRHDVLRARAHLNFSALGMNPKPAQRAALFEAVNMAQFGAMPLPSFTALHPEARVNPADLNELKAFLAPWGDLPPELSEPAKLIAPSSAEPVVSSLDFDPQLTDWRLLSVTDRGDNNSLRFILGNDKAVKARREGNTKVWPDGARFAKIGWQQRRNADVG